MAMFNYSIVNAQAWQKTGTFSGVAMLSSTSMGEPDDTHGIVQADLLGMPI